MDRLAELKSALKAKTDEADRIAGTFKIEDGKIEVSQEQADEYRKLLGQGTEIKGLIEAEEMAKGLRDFQDAPAGSSLAVATGAGAQALANQAKDLGSMFVASEEFKDLIASGGATMRSAWQVEGMDMGGMWGQKDVYSTLPTGTSIPPRFGQTERDALIPLARRTQRVRDLFPARPTTASLIDYFRVSGFTNAASVVPERVGSAFGLKPQSGLAWTVAQAPVRTIAHWEVAHRNVLADEPALRATINTELLYGLRLAEDYQILQGTGTGEDLLGVLNTPGIQTYSQATVSTDKSADAVRRAATRVMLAYYEPTGVVLHPYDWEEIELDKDTQGRYLYSQVAVGTQKVLWRMPVVDTPAIPQHTTLVGAFGLGAQLYDREQGNIRIAEQHGDFFLRNAVVILAEERLALATRIPESFVKVTLAS
jgi:HK97 family phage major capsid protein